ncbi:hypothetical protein CDL12_30516 [Handroanthus impetiginosus]|uniref:Helitron helicase-like domain-containing protein n=1 Tax=Handroanthus impetiginosus TaxID=429701 RepID=A0A2G9FVC9_9LAMI|nr:hypothetical protein CDL12_30516 [Handroanthus impetiginosus]
MDVSSGVFQQRRLDRMKRKYASLSITERQEYINKVKENKKRRNENKRKQQEVNTSSPNVPLVEKNSIPNDDNYQRLPIKWLLRAQMISCQSKGLITYDSICSEIHELKKVPNCIHCGAVRFEYEPQSFCCGNGKIKLASIQMLDELYELYTSQLEEAANFRKNIRGLNCIFSLTSFGVKLDKEFASARRGVYTFRARGMVYHDLPGLIPNKNGPGNFQLYFVETENEVENRMNILDSSSFSKGIVRKLIQIMEINPYAKIFRRLKDYPSTNDVQLHISKDVKLDQRVYNSPSADQVAAIWVEGNNPNMAMERDIVVHAYSGHKHRIKHYYGCYDPLQCPLLFPKGDTGWHQNIKKMDTRKSNGAVSIFILGSPIVEEQQTGYFKFSLYFI